MSLRYKHGWGDCSHCGCDTGATKNGLAVRHGFIRIKRGYKRVIMPDLESGKDHHACEGSGKKLDNYYKL